jgi:hypothetical protein
VWSGDGPFIEQHSMKASCISNHSGTTTKPQGGHEDFILPPEEVVDNDLVPLALGLMGEVETGPGAREVHVGGTAQAEVGALQLRHLVPLLRQHVQRWRRDCGLRCAEQGPQGACG